MDLKEMSFNDLFGPLEEICSHLDQAETGIQYDNGYRNLESLMGGIGMSVLYLATWMPFPTAPQMQIVGLLMSKNSPEEVIDLINLFEDRAPEYGQMPDVLLPVLVEYDLHHEQSNPGMACEMYVRCMEEAGKNMVENAGRYKDLLQEKLQAFLEVQRACILQQMEEHARHAN